MIQIKVNYDEALQRLGAKKGELRTALFRALSRSTSLARETVLDNIKNGANKNLGWPPFASSTLKRKAARGRSASGLIDKGEMWSRVGEKVSQSDLVGEVFPGVDYHEFLETGTSRMPARQTFGPVPEQIGKLIEDIFSEEIRKGVSDD